MGVSRKIGLHVIGTGFDPARLGRPTCVKLVDPTVEYKQRVRSQVGNSAMIVIRFFEPSQPLDVPVTRAREWWARHSGQIAGLVDANTVYESYNEITDGQSEAYNAFECERLRLMHNAGYRSCVGNWSVGCPDVPTWTDYAPMLGMMRDTDVLGLHEYWPDPDGLTDPWLCGRWRMIDAIRDRRIIVTEAGRDRVAGRGAPGWQSTTDAETYLAELSGYSGLLDQWPNVVGATVFQAGAVDPTWAPFDVSTIWDRVTAQYGEGSMDIRMGPLWERWLGWPITTRHGELIDPLYTGTKYAHKGVDIGAPEGTPILAPFDGIVDVCALGTGSHADRGNYLWLLRAADLENPVTGEAVDALFCHLQELPGWKTGDRIARGTAIGRVGRTGLATGPHLHLRIAKVRKDAPAYTVLEDLDPETVLAG